MSNKTHLRQTMLDLAEGRLRFAEQTYAQYLVGAAGRGDEPSESDAASRAVNNAALAQAFECPIHDHQEVLEVLRQIDFGPRDSVETGAVRSPLRTSCVLCEPVLRTYTMGMSLGPTPRTSQ